MSGLVKQKKYNWQETNISLFGSDLEKNCKKEAAETEKAWTGAGQSVGLQVWRINKFKVEHVPVKDHGHFYRGDSYIVLNTYKKLPTDLDLEYDVHFWIGEDSTQDEYGTAAYKTVELDTFLDDKPVQHREVQGYEGSRFKGYFKNYTLLDGGYETGFNHVEPNKREYKKRLLHVHGTRNQMEVKEIPMLRGALNSSDVFILDLGSQIYQFNGSRSNPSEKSKANQYITMLLENRTGRKCQRIVLDELDTSTDHAFFTHFKTGKPETEGKDDCDGHVKRLYRLSDAHGKKLKMEKIAEGPAVNMSLLDRNDVFFLDCGKELWIWVGKGASQNESKLALQHAHIFLTNGNHPCPNASVTVLREGHSSMEFKRAFNA